MSPKILCYFVIVIFHGAVRGHVQFSIHASISQFPKVKSKIHEGSKRGGEGGAGRPEGGFARPSFSEWPDTQLELWFLLWLCEHLKDSSSLPARPPGELPHPRQLWAQEEVATFLYNLTNAFPA